MKMLSIIIPCYNEAKNIPLILQKFDHVIQNCPIEVILVNNGSFDESEEILQHILANYPFARTVKIEVNQGYGYGILFGLNHAKGDFIGWTHADLQTDPADVIKAFQLLAKHTFNPNVFIKGSRKNRSLFDTFFTIGMSIFESLYLKKKLWDINAQPTIFHRTFYQKWQKPPCDFSLDLYAFYMAKKHNLSILRFPVLFPKRLYGFSSWNTGIKAKWKFIIRTIKFSINLKKELDHDIHSSPH